MMNKGNFIPFVPTRACALCMPSMDGLTSTPSPTIFAIPAKAVCTFVYFDFAHTYAFYLDIPLTSQVSLRFRVYFYSDQCMWLSAPLLPLDNVRSFNFCLPEDQKGMLYYFSLHFPAC